MEKVNLRSIVEFYIGGGWGKDSPQDTFVQSAYVIRGTDFDKVKIKPTQSVPYRFHTESNLRSRRLNIGDIVFEVSGGSKDQPVGRCILITAELLNSFDDDVIPASFCKKISPNQSLVNPYYFFAHLQHVWNTREIIQWQVQSTGLSNFNFESFLDEYQISLPPLPIQRRIAGILSAYDDLIENNQRRIAILEAMARGLYREWFVHYRYPGHEGVPLVDSPLGPIPQGWEVRKLTDICRLTMGQSPKSEYYNEVGDGVAFHQGVTDFGDRFPSDRVFCSVGGRYAETGDILFSVRAPVGRMNIANKRIILGRGLSAIRHNDNYQAFLWEQLRNRFTKDDMMGNGSIFASVTKDDMQGINLLCPPYELVESVTTHFNPLHLEVSTLSQKTQNLRRTRDLLLPRLLSGQLDVGALDHA